MTAAAVIKLLLSLALRVAEYIRNKQLLDAGDARAVARMLGDIAKRVGVADQVRAEVAAMTDADLDGALRGDDT